jgi:hypothetical protein
MLKRFYHEGVNHTICNVGVVVDRILIRQPIWSCRQNLGKEKSPLRVLGDYRYIFRGAG